MPGKKTANVYAVSDGQAETVPVPYGFYYVGGTVQSGVVISDNKADQNQYKGQEDVPAGVAYNADGTVNQENSELQGNQFVWIPCTIDEYKKINFELQNSTGWDAETGSIDPVTKLGWQNGNFVSSKVSSGKITTKAGEIPYYHADYTTAVNMADKMYNTEYLRSGLITGTMWDRMMAFMTDNTGNYTELESSTWGNYKNTTVTYTAGQGRYLIVDINNGSTENAKVSDSNYHCGIRTTASSEGMKKRIYMM